MLKAVGTAIILFCVAALAGCTTTEAPDGKQRVETWSSSSSYVNGKWVTEKDHKVEYKDKPTSAATPDWAFAGVWHIQDYTETAHGTRKCAVEIFPTKVGRYNYRSRFAGDCHSEMRNIVAWRPTGETVGDVIVFVDGAGVNIGEFDRVGQSLYRGVFILTNGEVVKAHLKRW